MRYSTVVRPDRRRPSLACNDCGDACGYDFRACCRLLCFMHLYSGRNSRAPRFCRFQRRDRSNGRANRRIHRRIYITCRRLRSLPDYTLIRITQGRSSPKQKGKNETASKDGFAHSLMRCGYYNAVCDRNRVVLPDHRFKPDRRDRDVRASLPARRRGKDRSMHHFNGNVRKSAYLKNRL